MIDENLIPDDNCIKEVPAKGWVGANELPFIFLESDNELVTEIIQSYGLDNFPLSNLLVRSTDGSQRHIYIVSDMAKQVLQASNSYALKLVNTGVRLFTKSYGGFRISNEGIQTINPFLSTLRVVEVSDLDLKILIEHEHPKFDSFSNEANALFSEIRIFFIYI